MSDAIHEALLDRMPEVARGAEVWSAADRAHLEGCAECRSSWALVQAATEIGAKVERRFDTAAATQAVVLRLRAGAARSRIIRRRVLGLVAAAAAVTLYLAVPRAPMATAGSNGGVTASAGGRFLPELDSLSTEELATVAEQVDLPASQLEIIEGQPLLDLDTTQLERVLRSLEG
jgi:hypothetical protein